MQVKFRVVMLNKARNGKKYLDYHSNLFKNAEEIISTMKDGDPDIVVEKIHSNHFYVSSVSNRFNGFDFYIYPVIYNPANSVAEFLKSDRLIRYRGYDIIEITTNSFMVQHSDCMMMISTKTSLEEALFFIDTYLFSVKGR